MTLLRRGLTPSLTLAFTLLAAAPAHAHLTNTGFGPFYDGLAHLFVTPEDLLPVLALALLAGLRGPRFGRTVLFTLPIAWLAGSAAGMLAAPQVALPAATAALIIALGALLAADRALPLAVVTGLAVALGLWSGCQGGIDLAKAGAGGLAVAGVTSGLFVVVALLAGPVATLRVPWGRVAVRVAGSWIAAIGLLILGWSIRGVIPG